MADETIDIEVKATTDMSDIESLEQSEESKGIVFPIIFGDAAGFSKRVINKVNNRNRIMQLTAWAAVIAILCSGTNELLLRSENTTLVNELSKMVQKMGDFFSNTFNKGENVEESTTSGFIDETTTLPKDDENRAAEIASASVLAAEAPLFS